MKDAEIEALVSTWGRDFAVRLTAVQHMGLQQAIRDAIANAPSCGHHGIETHPRGAKCVSCGAIWDAYTFQWTHA